MSLCHITGIVYLPDGTPASRREVNFYKIPDKVTADYLGAVVPEPIVVLLDNDGAIDVNLITGNYHGYTLDRNGKNRYEFKAVVPESATADFSDLIAAAAPVEPLPAWLQQAIEARDESREEAERAEAAAEEAAAYAQFSVKAFGAVGDGVTDDTAAFLAARAATSGHYSIPPGTYVLTAPFNVWNDTFSAVGKGVVLKIDGVDFDVSGAFAGGWKNSSISNSGRYLNWFNTQTGRPIARWSDGENESDSHRFWLPFDVRRDSHSFISSPGTLNGSSDMLWRRSDDNSDPRGNRFQFDFQESSDEFRLLLATTASGSPSFDSAIAVTAGLSRKLEFRALRANFLQGWTVQTRAGGGGPLKLSMIPGATEHVIKDETSDNTLGTFNRSTQKIAGISFETLLDKPAPHGSHTYAAVFSDSSSGGLPLPFSKVLTTLGTTINSGLFRLKVAASTSGGSSGVKDVTYILNNNALSPDSAVNTIQPQITAEISMSGSDVVASVSYAGGLGAGIRVALEVEWMSVHR